MLYRQHLFRMELMRTPFTCTLCAAFLLLLVASADLLHAQSRYYDVWTFSDSVGLDFRSGTPVPISTNIRALEGCATMCDPNTGGLLFYTNGSRVWNRDHAVMKNGTGLYGGTSSTQSSLAVPHPGDSTLFYIFTVQSRTAGGIIIDDPPPAGDVGLRYSIVDMKGDGGLGEITEKNVPLLSRAAEKVAGIRHSNGCGIWIITHELGGQKFYAWLLTPLGVIDPPVISDIWPPYSKTSDAGYLKASPDGKFLFAVRGQQYDGDLFRFNPATGEVGPLLAQVPAEYGASFSPDSKFLYVGYSDQLGTLNEIVQYDLSRTDLSDKVILTRSLGVAGKDRFFALQLGPDGKIYAARKNVDGSVDVAVINNPNEKGPAAGYQNIIDPTFPEARYDFLGLPNCIDGFLGESDARPFGKPGDVDIEGDTLICLGEQTELSVADGTAFRWEPSDYLSCDDCPNPVASPRDTLTYVVTVFDGEFCPRRDSITINVVYPPETDAGEDREICLGESVQLNGKGGVGYRWTPSTGLDCTDCSAPVAMPVQTTTYYLESIGSNGCSSVDSVKITVNGTVRATVTDAAICKGEQTRLFAEGAAEYEWSPAEGLSCTDCASPVAQPSRSTTYRVRATTDGKCPSVDSVSVIVHDPPEIFLSNDTVICLGESVPLKAWGGVSYAWSPSRGLGCDDCPDPVAAPTTTTTYRVWVTNEFGCSEWDSVTIIVETSGTVEATGDTAFCPGGVAQLSATGAVKYAWSPADGLDCVDCSAPVASPLKTITYYVTGTNSSGECPALDSVTVVVYDIPDADAGPDTAICSGESVHLRASGGTAHWNFSPDLSCLDCAAPVARPGSTNTYYVTIESPDGCIARDSIIVRVLPDPEVSAGSDQTICAGDDVQLNASDGVRWLWEPSDGLSCTDCRNPVATPMRSTVYRLTAWNPEGCPAFDEVSVDVREKPQIVHLQIKRYFSGYTGEQLMIPVVLLDSLSGTDITTLEFKLVYDGGLMVVDPQFTSDLLEGTVLEGWDVNVLDASPGYLHLQMQAPDGVVLSGEGEFLRFRSRLYLSGNTATELDFDISSPSNCYTFSTIPGFARVDSVCGLSFRLMELTANKYVVPTVSPNPGSERITFEFGLGLDGPTMLEVYDATGRRVGVLLNTELNPGSYSVEWDVREVPSGIYWYRLHSGDWQAEGQIRVHN